MAVGLCNQHSTIPMPLPSSDRFEIHALFNGSGVEAAPEGAWREMGELHTLARSAQRLLWIAHPEDALSLFRLSAIPEALQKRQNLRENGDRISRISFGPIEGYPFCLEVDVLTHQTCAFGSADPGLPHKFHQISRILGLRIELLSSDVLHDGLKLLPVRSLTNRLLRPEKFEADRRAFAERARLESDDEQVAGETDVF